MQKFRPFEGKEILPEKVTYVPLSSSHSIKPTVRNATYSKTYKFRFTCNIDNFDGIENDRG